MTITTGENAKYLVCRFVQTAQDSLSVQEIANTVQVEEGTIPTKYEEYGATPQTSLKIPMYSSGNRSYTANWVKNYEIEYELDGGTITNQPTTYNETTATFTLPTPTKEGYTFTGWTGGKNLIYLDDVASGNVSGIDYNVNSNLVTLTGSPTTRIWFPAHMTSFKPLTNYRMSIYSIEGEWLDGNIGISYFINDYSQTIPSPSQISEANKWIAVTYKGANKNGYLNMDTSFYNQVKSIYMMIGLDGSGNLRYNNFKYKMQLEKGTDPTPFEECISTPQTTVTIPKGSKGNRIYTANWVQNTE